MAFSTSTPEIYRAVQSESTEPAALMAVTINNLNDSINGLGAQVDWLLQKIAPVCQPAGKLASGSAQGHSGQVADVHTAPSAIRMELLGLIERVGSISARISAVTYTIEL